MTSVPNPTPIFRLVHEANLEVLLCRGGLHAPNHTPKDELCYKTIHNMDIQRERQTRVMRCGPGGTIHDYVPFYFGYLSPMLLQLKTGQVAGYNEGQEPLVYLVSNAQAVCSAGLGFVFSDGHGIAAYTRWYDDLAKLDKVDWDVVYLRYWADTIEDMDRQRRKQAEFMIHKFCDWTLIREIAVVNNAAKARVENILGRFPGDHQRPVSKRPDWYY
jgi:hypothetical protein